jgi:hypothetical protein
MSTRQLILTAVGTVVMVLLIGTLFWFLVVASRNNTADQIDVSLRASCLRAQAGTIDSVNETRIIATADFASAADKALGKASDRARLVEAMELDTININRSSRLQSDEWRHAMSPIDQASIKRSTYSCAALFPNPKVSYWP